MVMTMLFPSLRISSLSLFKRATVPRVTTNIQRMLSTKQSEQPGKEKVMDLMPLKLSNELYAVFRIHNRSYLATLGDRVILPFKLKQAEVGDILRLTDVVAIGSRNYKAVGDPIDESLYTMTATVLEKTKRKFQVREVTKRRNRKVRHAKSKGDLTIIRISKLQVN